MKRTVDRQGFTLVEMIMVLLILGIAAAVTVPVLGRSIRGSRLRTAGRELVMAGRYARSIAVLSQKEMCLSLDLGSGSLQVESSGDRTVALKRQFDRVRIERVEVRKGQDEDETYTEGVCRVMYRNNGTSDAYGVRLRDESGGAMSVDVDTLASARVEREP